MCHQCLRRGSECEYISESAEDTPFSALKRQIETLQRQLNVHEEIFQHLQTVPEQEAWEIMQRIRAASHASDVQLTSGADPDSIDVSSEINETLGISALDMARPLSSQPSYSMSILGTAAVDPVSYANSIATQATMSSQEWGNTSSDPTLMYRSRMGGDY
jgi:hypothetical protein